ncbi:MAG TPA: hypothetical protein DCP92_13965 [Nitrospiraceae bacterium]|jgi:hypothetical protein|nr:hypothetical protein [Nitrospiraceae bacterium]
MEREESKESHTKMNYGALAHAYDSWEKADGIKSMIKEMPQIDPPVGLLPALLEAIKGKMSCCGREPTNGRDRFDPLHLGVCTWSLLWCLLLYSLLKEYAVKSPRRQAL